MRKRFFVVDCKTKEIVTSVKLGAGIQVVYDDPPERRKGSGLFVIGIHCDIAMFVLAFTGYFIQPLFQVLMPLAGVAAAFGFVLTYVGWWMERNDKKYSESNRNKKLRIYNGCTPSVDPWLDPYGIARDAVDVPGKKTYFIVDAEKNAVVDVLHLGRWGQKRLNRRAKRQALKTDE